MAKSTTMSKTAEKNNRAMIGATKYFLLGGLAEAFLLMIRKYYVYGTAQQVVAWDEYMMPLAIAGLVVALCGGAGFFALRKAGGMKACICKYVGAFGAFMAVTSVLTKMFYTTALTPLSVIVPVVMLLGMLWHLYDRECALSITILGVSTLALWIARRTLHHLTLGVLAYVGVVVCILALCAVAYLTKQAVAGTCKCKYPLVAKKTDPSGIYLACGVSVVGLAIALVSVSVAYYALWAMAAVMFLLGVYYTVKQL